MPKADVLVHSGDISHNGTEDEVLDFLNWFIELPYQHKIFVTGNHDLCLWDAEGIEDLPDNGEDMIPNNIDVVITHEPPIMILDQSSGIHWGNAPLRNRILEAKPRYHLFGHAHNGYGILKQDGIVFSNAALLDDMNRLVRKPRLFMF